MRRRSIPVGGVSVLRSQAPGMIVGIVELAFRSCQVFVGHDPRVASPMFGRWSETDSIEVCAIVRYALTPAPTVNGLIGTRSPNPSNRPRDKPGHRDRSASVDAGVSSRQHLQESLLRLV